VVDLHNSSNRHFRVGVVILVLGVVLLLDQIGILDAGRIFMFWPLALIFFGYYKFTHACTMAGRFWGGFCLLLGISLQAEEFMYGHIRFDTVWPVLLICAGILLILKRYEARNYGENVPPGAEPPPGPTIDVPPGAPPSPPTPGPAPETAPGAASTPPPNPMGTSGSAFNFCGPAQTKSNFAGEPAGQRWPNRDFDERMRDFGRRMDEFGERMHKQWQQHPHSNFQNTGGYAQSASPRLNEVAIFWGGKRRVVSKNFSGGDVVAIFGGFDVDLRDCEMQGNLIVIDIVSIFGGGDIHVPPGWEVVMDTVGIFGGCGDRTHHPDQPAPGATNPDGSPVPPPKKLIVKGVAIFGGFNVKN